MKNRSANKTADWRRYEIQLSIPKEATRIMRAGAVTNTPSIRCSDTTANLRTVFELIAEL